MVRVRYIVNDVEEAIKFYVSNLGFEIEQVSGTKKGPGGGAEIAYENNGSRYPAWPGRGGVFRG